MIRYGLPPQSDGDVLIVGAGPAGIVAALELRRLGIAVTMLAGGGDGFDAEFQALADAAIVDPRRHAPISMAVRRALGGTSLLWGGRCVAFDDDDFAARPYVPASGWPIGADDVAPWYDRAVDYLNAGEPVFSAPLDGVSDAEGRFDQLERWSEGRNLRRLHAAALDADAGLRICLGVVAVGFEIDPVTGHLSGIVAAVPSGPRAILRARAVVLACGGLETTRLLLAAQVSQPRLFGGAAGPLGRYYMGHLEGRLAEIAFDRPGGERDFDFFVDPSGRYVRRRMTLTAAARQRYGLLNLACWLDNPPIENSDHNTAILSLAYLSLAVPGLGRLLAPDAIRRKHLEGGVAGLSRHLGNIFRGAPWAIGQAASYLRRRYVARPRLPGFFIANPARRYVLFYHAEQAPNPESTVRLGGERDGLGMPRLVIDLRYGDIDANSVVASHAVIDRALRRTGIGRLDYTVAEADRAAWVLAHATDGYHQIGTTRMSNDPRSGIVDRDCRVHGMPNLFIASSSVFPTSGQANPTLLLAALSARLAAHLAQVLPALPEPGTAPASPPAPEAALSAAT
jgi:choline dehydrogenase-like flavoprotein